MPFTKRSLQSAYSLSIEAVNQTLLACNLSLNQPEYSDQQIANYFEKIRTYVDQGYSFEAAKDLLRREIGLQQRRNLDHLPPFVGKECRAGKFHIKQSSPKCITDSSNPACSVSSAILPR